MVKMRPQRRSERGAALFIVVMVLALITAVGVFAVRSASLADVAAGYDREAAQASLLSQYATSTAATYLSSPAGSALFGLMTYTNQCPTTMGAYAKCFLLDDALLSASTFADSGEYMLEPSGTGTNSSLNVNGTTTGAFFVELLNPSSKGVPDAGQQAGKSSALDITLTALAQIRPAGACTAAVASNAGQQMTRALVSGGSTLGLVQ